MSDHGHALLADQLDTVGRTRFLFGHPGWVWFLGAKGVDGFRAGDLDWVTSFHGLKQALNKNDDCHCDASACSRNN